MPQELTCRHLWSSWFEAFGDKEKRWRMCGGLCKKVHLEGEPEPRIVVAKLEECA